jgi:hypothetical protein
MIDLLQGELTKGDKVYLKSGSREMTVIDPERQTVMVGWELENGEKTFDNIPAVCLTRTPTSAG